ncbi:MAG: efflux RND transporter periplasmic adaptor subunit [Gemmatimonadota bacterium]|nr:efflux RND transporter periplasmic adaptor subunit [Gemmatimonadota bacterium]MDQ8177484.1 efflux RND transporter periplasmic adaptor subunit [Gemmatimonadota bacterium]
MIRRSTVALFALLVLAGCGKDETAPLTIRTADVARRTIVVQAEATGVIEPINVVEVKSRASGQVTQMPVETGTLVRPGDLIVQLDTRDVQNQFNQAKADLEAAEKKLEVSAIQKKRSDELLGGRIITAQENEAAQLDYANAQSAIVRARASLDLAQQRLDDARVTAPVTGTIIEKPVALGQVIQSGTSAVGGGTTIVKMADLTRVRARALVNETDIGSVRAGLEATVIVDAFPDRPFRGTVEKIEPQAIVQQNVTMFPVLVTLDNQDGLLMPGMNGEVSIVSERREEVIAVSNDAVRSVREAAQAASALGLNPDSVQAQLRAAMGGGFGGGRGANGGGAAPQPTAGGAPQGRPAAAGGPAAATAATTPPECTALETARRAKPAAAKKLDDLTAKMRAPDADRRALMGEMRAVYEELGVDAQTARGCRQQGGNGGGQPGRPTGNGGSAGAMGASSPRRAATRSGLVFVQKADSTWEPRVVRLGVSDYDYTEVVSGLQPGEKVALLSAAVLQAQREQSNDRFRAMTGGGSPLGGGGGGGSGAGAAGGGRPGGAGGGGGGGAR